jgi:hypothetical protein
MPWTREFLEQIEATYGLHPGETEDLEARYQQGDTDEQIAELICGDQVDRFSADQCPQIAVLQRRKLGPRR